MARIPELPTDLVVYTIKDIYLDGDTTIRLLDGSVLNVWGTLFINGNPIGTIGVIPIATQAEAEAGTNNSNVMTPLRTSQHLAVNGVKKTGDYMTGILDMRGAAINLKSADGVTTYGRLLGSIAGAYLNALGAGKSLELKTNDITRVLITDLTVDIFPDTIVQNLQVDASLIVPTPTEPDHAVTKQYVDDAVLGGGPGGGITQAEADTRYVNIDGDTMTGSLALGQTATIKTDTNPANTSLTLGTDAANKEIRLTTNGSTRLRVTDANVYVQVPLNLAGDPTENLHAATKQYVDTSNLPEGGATGQVLAKSGASDYQAGWIDPPSGGAGGVSDGDKGDIVVSASGTVWLFDSSVVTAVAKTLLDDANTSAMRTTLELGNVDNTSDADKPVSTAQAAALLNKADKAVTFSTTAPLGGGGTLAANRTLTVSVFDSANSGIVPASGGGTVNFLRADGTWVPSVAGGGALYQFVFNSATTPPPVSGGLRFNNAAAASTTAIYVHYMTNDGIDIKQRLLLSSVVGSKLYVQDKDDSTKYQIFLVTGAVTDDTTYATIPVSFVSGGSALSPTQQILAGFIYNTTTASEIQSGIVELATSAETLTGTDTTRATHPAGIKTVADTKVNKAGDLMTGTLSVKPTVDDIALKLFSRSGGSDDALLEWYRSDGTTKMAYIHVDHPSGMLLVGGASGSSINLKPVDASGVRFSVTDTSVNAYADFDANGDVNVGGGLYITDIFPTTVNFDNGGTITDNATQVVANRPVKLPADPTAALEAATKQYVDTQRDTRQPLDADLTTIAGLTATTDNVIQSVGGAWASRTPAQLTASLAAATATASGIVELATTAEATAQTDTVRAVTPAGLADRVLTSRSISTTAPLTGGGDLTANRTLTVSAATETATGVVELATTAEATTGTDTTRAVTAAGVKAVADTKAPIRRTIKADTTTAYAPILTDENQMVTLSNASAITVTAPSNATQAFPIGAEVDFLWLGAGQPTFAAGSGATVNGTPGLKLRAQYSAATLKKVSTNGWVAIGDLAA